MDALISDLGPLLVSGGIVGAIATVAVAVITSRSKRGTERADAAATITESATDLLTPMREELARLRADQREQAEAHREDLQTLTRRVAKLEGMVEEYARREWALVRYVRALIDSHRRNAPDADVPPIPQNLSDLI